MTESLGTKWELVIHYLALFFGHNALFDHVDLREIREEGIQDRGPSSHEGGKKLI